MNRVIQSTEKTNTSAKQSKKPRPKIVKNKNLLSFGNDDDDEEGEVKLGSIVSYQQASGVVKKEELVSKQSTQTNSNANTKEKGKSDWAAKMKEKLLQKEKEKEKEKKEEKKEVEEEEEKSVSVENMAREKAKARIREMKKRSKEVQFMIGYQEQIAKEYAKPSKPIELMESKEQSILTASEYKRKMKRMRNEAGVDKTKNVI